MPANSRLFPPERLNVEGRPKIVQVVRCTSCPETLTFNVNTASRGGMSDDTIRRKAALKGWEFTRKGRDATCPACERGMKTLAMVRKIEVDEPAVRATAEADIRRPMTDEEWGQSKDELHVAAVLTQGASSLDGLRDAMSETGSNEVFDAYQLVQPPEPQSMPTDNVSHLPRQPSREDKRRILEKLAEVYVSEEVGYAAEWTDDKIAALMSVPPAWVRDLRVEFHGENAGNEAGSAAERERRRALNEIKANLATARRKIDDALATIAAGERVVQSCEARLAKLEQGKAA